MKRSSRAQTLSVVADLGAGSGRGAWRRLDRRAVADRLAELVQRPSLISQGRLNLCGPALVFKVWLERDPAACVAFARALFEEGCAPLGSMPVRPSRGLLAHAYRLAHARTLTPAPDRDLFVLVASEMFDRPRSLPARLGKYVVSLLPNHWIALRSRIIEPGAEMVTFTFWSWGADQPPVVLQRSKFRRCYYGAVIADTAMNAAR